MRLIKACALVVLLQTSAVSLFAQGEIPVNMYTGTGSFQVPIWNVVSRDLSDPVSLVYSVRGVKLDERGGRFGVSWDVSAGGSVSREVRGLPDDFKGTGNDRRRGWLFQKYNTSTYLSGDVANLPNSSDNSGATCTDESNDYNQINGYGYDNDTEPDIYYFNVGGYSGSFVFDNSTSSTPVVRLIPYQDIKIVPTFNTSTGPITAFTITTNTGTVYTLDVGIWEIRYTEKLISETTVEFLKTAFEQYSKAGANHDNKKVGYNIEWKLSKAASTTSDEISYTYTTADTATSNDIVKAYITRYSDNKYYTVNVYSDNKKTALRYVSAINVKESGSTFKKALEFYAPSGVVTAIKVYDYRRGSSPNDYVKQFDLGYTTSGTRTFLKIVSESTGGGGPSEDGVYTFTYMLDYLPPKDSKSKDYWGYYNGKPNTHLAPSLYVYPDQVAGEQIRIDSIPGYTLNQGLHIMDGADRSVDTVKIQFGTLQSISYPYGGVTKIKYESNEYYDTVANLNFKGGGLRIKSLHYYDALNPSIKISKTFTYSDANGKSYGRLLSKPSFAFVTREYRDPFSSAEQIPDAIVDEWTEWVNYNKIIVRMENDISSPAFTQGSAVGYKQVKVSRPGSGYSIHEFEMPGVYGTSSSGVWSATQNKMARTTGCPSVQWFKSGINGFPFTPNPNFDHERGLPKRKRDYNEGDTLVSEVTTTYQYVYKTGSSADYVYGLHFEKYPNSDATMFAFGKYFLITDVAKVPASEVSVTYDMKDPSRSVAQSAYFYHESPYHKLLTRTKSVLADGTIYQSYTKYPMDYQNTDPYSDDMVESINTLKTTGRNGVPIETYQTQTKPGESEKVISGSIVKFSDFGTTGKVLPQEILSWQSDVPVLKSSYFETWNDDLFSWDSRYKVVSTIQGYGAYDIPTGSIGKSRVPGATVYGYNSTAPVATVAGAQASEVAFSDFETATSIAFTEGGTITYPAGRTGAKSINFSSSSSVVLSRTLNKGDTKYLFSGWFKHSASAITVNIKIKNSAGTTTYYNQNVTFTPTTATNTFEYFEKEVPIDNALTTTFKVEIAPVSGSWSLDEVAFYPINASLTSFAYTFPYGAKSVTSGRFSSFTEFDWKGRLKYVKDKDGNILKKQTHITNVY